MLEIKEGEWLYSFMGEELVNFKVADVNFDAIRLTGEDGFNTYCLYKDHCYRTKEDAIAGMLEALREITDCDCGEDEGEINYLYGRIPNCS